MLVGSSSTPVGGACLVAVDPEGTTREFQMDALWTPTQRRDDAESMGAIARAQQAERALLIARDVNEEESGRSAQGKWKDKGISLAEEFGDDDRFDPVRHTTQDFNHDRPVCGCSMRLIIFPLVIVSLTLYGRVSLSRLRSTSQQTRAGRSKK